MNSKEKAAIEAFKRIEQFSDIGDDFAAVVKMKSIATDARRILEAAPPVNSVEEAAREYDLLTLQNNLRQLLYVRPYDLEKIETTAVILCDAIISHVATLQSTNAMQPNKWDKLNAKFDNALENSQEWFDKKKVDAMQHPAKDEGVNPIPHTGGLKCGCTDGEQCNGSCLNNAMGKINPKDWQEDFKHENGNYQSLCTECNEIFFGNKRRMICKACFGQHTGGEEGEEETEEPDEPTGDQIYNQPGWEGGIKY